MTGAGWTAPLRPIISTERFNRSAGFQQQHAREASKDPHGRNHTGSGGGRQEQEGLKDQGTNVRRSPFAVRRSPFAVRRSALALTGPAFSTAAPETGWRPKRS